MYRNILIPVDLSHDTTSAKIFKIAKSLGAENAQYTILHVTEKVPAFFASQIPDEVLRKNKNEATGHLDRLATTSGLKAKPVLMSGNASMTILEYADHNKIDCIILASHKPGLTDYFLGSTAARVIRHATCAVHVSR